MDPDLFSCSFSSSFFAPSAPLYYFPSGKSLPLFYTDKGKREEQERTGRKKQAPLVRREKALGQCPLRLSL